MIIGKLFLIVSHLSLILVAGLVFHLQDRPFFIAILWVSIILNALVIILHLLVKEQKRE